MMRQLFFLLFFVLYSSSASPIKHVVVVMMENNSMDRIFGMRLKTALGHYNYGDKGKTKHWTEAGAANVPFCDPAHDISSTTEKIFGMDKNMKNATMSGFYAYEQAAGNPDGCGVMDVFNQSSLPVINFLADEGVLFDRYFCSVPGPTWCNRNFAIMGTSAGETGTGGWYRSEDALLFPQRTVFDQMTDAGLSWANYFQTTPWELQIETILHNPKNLKKFDTFLQDCKDGTLPSYSWVNPRSGVDGTTGYGSNDQHPDHDMAQGELFLKQIYDALRASPVWNETVLMINYDEHGGFWDHVPPPGKGEGGVPRPDNLTAGSFKFDRLGVRVPLVLVSPWLPKGLIETKPNGPQPSSEYEHCSVISTARKLLGVKEGPLTPRDAWAGSFEHLFDLLKEPRTDLPMHAPNAPPLAPPDLLDEANRPLNDLQQNLIGYHERVSQQNFKRPKRQGDLHKFLTKHFEHAILSVEKANSMLGIVIAVTPFPETVEDRFKIDKTSRRIYTKSLTGGPGNSTHFCLTQKGVSEPLTMELCQKSGTSQTFDFHTDGTVTNTAGECVTAINTTPSDTTEFGVYNLLMQPCDGSVFQGFSWYPYDSIYLGDVAANWIVVKK